MHLNLVGGAHGACFRDALRCLVHAHVAWLLVAGFAVRRLVCSRSWDVDGGGGSFGSFLRRPSHDQRWLTGHCHLGLVVDIERRR